MTVKNYLDKEYTVRIFIIVKKKTIIKNNNKIILVIIVNVFSPVTISQDGIGS